MTVRAGLEDAMVHGQDVQGVYGELLQFLPLESQRQKYQFRVTNNVNTASVLRVTAESTCCR